MNFNFITSGPESNPVVLFLHGFMGQASDWQIIMEELSRDYYCIALDLPGHGQTKIPDVQDSFGFAEFCEELLEWLESKKIQKPILVGYSMGGRIATYLAVYYPEKISKLILESASPGLANEKERAIRFESDIKLAEMMTNISLEEFLRGWYEQPLFATLSRNQKESLIDRKKEMDKRELAAALTIFSTGRQVSLWEKLDQIQAPVHLIAGELDAKFVNIAQKIKQNCPGFSLTIVPGAGHITHVEKRDNFLAVLKQLLSKQDR